MAFCINLAVISLLASLSAAQVEILNIMFISSGGGQYNSSGAEPAVDLAIEIINNNTIIPGYQLRIASRGNSSCDRREAFNAYFSNISVGMDKIAVVGSGCSVATEAVAEISSFWNITQLSYASSADTLNNREKFPNLWRTHPTESNLATSVIAIMEYYGWKKLRIITQEESLFTETTLQLTRMLKSRNITVDVTGKVSFTSSENVMDVEEFFQPEIRIYLLNMYSIHARRLLCAAAQLKQNDTFYVPGYVWITLGWYRDYWWTEAISQDMIPGCNDQVLQPLINQALGIQQANSAQDRSAPTDVILTAGEFKQQYSARLNGAYSFEPTAYYAYDVIWALAFALNRSLAYFREENISIESFSYATGKNISEVIQDQLGNPEFAFNGVSGYVEFNENGTRRGSKPQILKYRNISDLGPERVLIAVLNGTSFIYINNESNETVWPGYIPPDGSSMTVVIPIKLPLTATYYALASIGIIFAIVCLFFNIIFRKRKIVRLISPNLNYVIIVGGILLYATVYFYTSSSIDPTVITTFCHIRFWTQTIGYFACFGTIVVKMWRVYYIFHNPTAKKKSRIPKDWHLFLVVVAMCLVMVIIFIAVAAVGNYKAEEVDDNETPNSRNTTTRVIIEYHNIVCNGPGDIIWIVIIFVCIILTQLVAVFLAFRTRKVTIKALNDSKYLTIIIYLSTVIIITLIVCAVVLSRYLNADAAIYGGLIMLFTTVVLGLMFIPKMVILYKDPKGEKIFDRRQSQGTLNATVIEDTKIDDLEKHCSDLESRLGKYEDVTPFRSLTRSSSMRKQSYSTSLSYLPPSSANPMHSVHSIQTSPKKNDLPGVIDTSSDGDKNDKDNVPTQTSEDN